MGPILQPLSEFIWTADRHSSDLSLNSRQERSTNHLFFSSDEMICLSHHTYTTQRTSESFRWLGSGAMVMVYLPHCIHSSSAE